MGMELSKILNSGRGKPGWGRDSTRPEWWPKELPWANVRMDARTEEEKQKISWTHALRKIVINCYKYHGREDLLPAFSEEDEKANAIATANANVSAMSRVSVRLFSLIVSSSPKSDHKSCQFSFSFFPIDIHFTHAFRLEH